MGSDFCVELALGKTQSRRLYHLGFRCATVSFNTLEHANAHLAKPRPWQIYRDLAQHLIAIARPMYADAPLGSLDQSQTEAIAKILGDVSIYARFYQLRTTTIDLCLCVFPWAPFRKAKGGVKLYTLLDPLRIPTDLEFELVRNSPIDSTAYANSPGKRPRFPPDSGLSPMKNVGTLLRSMKLPRRYAQSI